MLIPMELLMEKYRLKVTGVLHVGAHLGEEARMYHDFFPSAPVTWVEANPDLIEPLQQRVARYGHRVVQALVADVDGMERPFIVTNNGQSSSILELDRHKEVSPDVHEVERKTLETTTLDWLVKDQDIPAFNFLNLDIQGAELLALTGATRSLRWVDYIYTEINIWELYQGCARVWELDAFLTEFIRVETSMAGNVGWGDSLFVRRPT